MTEKITVEPERPIAEWPRDGTDHSDILEKRAVPDDG
jgi:hypothetical protein